MVDPDCRRQGIGSTLLQAIEARLPQAARFELFTGARSTGNIRLYERAGYRAVRTETVSAKVTLVHMVKERAAEVVEP